MIAVDLMLPGIDGAEAASPKLQRRRHHHADRPRQGARQARGAVRPRRRLPYEAVEPGELGPQIGTMPPLPLCAALAKPGTGPTGGRSRDRAPVGGGLLGTQGLSRFIGGVL